MRLDITAHIVSIMLFASAVVFALGYYTGYKSVCTEFVEQCSLEALNDKVAAAVYTLYADTDASSESSDEEQEQEEEEGVSGEQKEGPATEKSDAVVAVADKTSSSEAQAQQANHQLLYEARLAGFGTHLAAERYVTQLRSVAIEAYVLTREARTSRGKKTVWYQVVTAPQPYDIALKTVNFLKKRDKLEGVILIEIPSEPQEKRKGAQ